MWPNGPLRSSRRLACWLRLRTFRASSCMRIWSVRGSSWRTSSAGAFALQDEGRASNATSQRIRQLERELARKEKALAEAAALLVLKKDREGSSRRGRRRRRAERELILTGIGKARSSGARFQCGVQNRWDLGSNHRALAQRSTCGRPSMWSAPPSCECPQSHGGNAAYPAHDEHSLRAPLPEAVGTAARRSRLVSCLGVDRLSPAASIWAAQ